MKDIPGKNETENMLEAGKACFLDGRLDQAAELLERAVRADPFRGDAHFELGKTYYVQKKYDLALRSFAVARAAGASGGDIHFLTAKAHKERGDFGPALKALAALASEGGFPSPYGDELRREYAGIMPCYLEQVRRDNAAGAYARTRQDARFLYGAVAAGDACLRNALLNEIEIAEKKSVLESRPRNLIVTLSTECNLRCVMCDWVRSPAWTIPRRTLDEIASFFPFLERIVWQGGEALLFEGLGRLVEEAGRHPRLRQVITTNGLLVDEEWAERFTNNNVDLTFSVDGVTKEVYERIRKGAKFETLLRRLRHYRERREQHPSRGITNFHMVVMRSNYRQIEAYLEFAREHGAGYVAFLPIEGNFNDPENIFHPADESAIRYLREALPRVRERACSYGLLVENRLPIDHEAPSGGLDADVGPAEKMPCHLPWIQMYIDYDGSVRPDCNCRRETSVGSAGRGRLGELWNGGPMQEYRSRVARGALEAFCNENCVRGRVSERYLKFM